MDELLNAPWIAQFSGSLGRETVKDIIHEALDSIRNEIRAGMTLNTPLDELVVMRVQSALRARMTSTLKPVINATGVIVHTNIGRAPLADEALHAVQTIASAYSTLEYAPEQGGRGERNAHVEWSICRITGAEAALVVNNNAAAVLLSLSATAAGREVIISTSELVEIGASFRIPEILSFSGAKMIAVGCTNSTRISDYRNAITEQTAVLLKVHPSNYRVEGFVKTTPRTEVAELADSRGLVFMEDIGSGLLFQPKTPFVSREHLVMDCVKAGCGIVTFSGDKLLGGPQIGVIVGAKKLIDKMKRHQLLRALRVDKMTLAAFEATLRLYLADRQDAIPVIRMIQSDKSVLLEKARDLCHILQATATSLNAHDFTMLIVETSDAIGGGAYPTDVLPGYGVAIRSASLSADKLVAGLRTAHTPVLSGIHDGSVILHVRTLLPGDERVIAASFTEAIG
jgi:L-seryl-tRNA(Ser) seleniumtransferase